MERKIYQIFQYYSELTESDLVFISKTVNESMNIYGKLKIANFLTYLNRSGICKFCISFSKIVLEKIKNRDIIYILKLIEKTDSSVFKEVYNNSKISEKEKIFVSETLSKEFIAMIYYLFGDAEVSCYDCYNNISTKESLKYEGYNYRPLYKNQVVLIENDKTYYYDLYDLIYITLKSNREMKELFEKYQLEVKIVKYIIKNEDK